MLKRYAQRIGTYKRKAVYRVPVVVLINDSRQCRTVAKHEFTVISQSPIDAANYAISHYRHIPEVEVYAWGIKGGETYRYNGWDSAIYAQMSLSHDAVIKHKQLTMELI